MMGGQSGRKVELVESARGLDVLAEAADEVVGDQRAADVRKDILLERDCESRTSVS